MFDKNALYINNYLFSNTFVFFITGLAFSQINKKLKVFGTGKNKNKSFFWFILFIVGIIIYFTVCCVFQRFSSDE